MSEHIDIDHELITIRHYLHAHPERSFREFGTSIYLTDQLKAHGIEILHNPLETGVVGLIQGEAGPGPRIGLRADIDGLPIDVTTYRIDGAYADGRHPAEVRFTGSLEDDLRRRDFTMNAVCHSAGRGFVDPFGGIGDIRAGRIRCVGDPHERFSEDALRILRAVRFAAQLGFAVEPETARAMYETAGGLARISAERIFSELTGALTAPYAGEAFAAFRALFAAVLPGCAERPLYPLNRLPADKAARFAAVLNVGEADTLRGLKSDRRTLEDVRFLHENRHFSGGRIELKKLLASHGERKARLLLGWLNADAALLDALAVAAAERLGAESAERLQSLHQMKKDYFPDG